MKWSYSAAKTFQRCQRQWFYNHVLANPRSHIPAQREAFILSKLQSIDSWRGHIVDQVIEHRLIPALNRGDLITRRELVRQARSIFDEQLAFADVLRYNPWHSLPEHKPLGNSNRARRQMYAELARLRQAMNQVRHIEPTGEEQFPA